MATQRITNPNSYEARRMSKQSQLDLGLEIVYPLYEIWVAKRFPCHIQKAELKVWYQFMDEVGSKAIKEINKAIKEVHYGSV